MTRFSLVICIFAALTTNTGYADECRKIDRVCKDGGKRVVDGITTARDCWEYQDTYECLEDNYTDYCSTIKQVPGCELISTECQVYGFDGKCNESIERFRCGNLLDNTEKEITYLDKEYTIGRDELDTKQCESLEKSSDCTEIEKVCVEGAETRIINNLSVYKDCWKYESKYSCYNQSMLSDCREYEKECKFLGEVCLSENQKGECRHKEKKFLCTKNIGSAPVNMQCSTAKYCIGDKCEESKYEPNKNLGKAISALSVLRDMQFDFEEKDCIAGQPNTCKVFKGNGFQCRINPIGARNCCKDNGWLTDLKLASCNENEKLLSKNKDNGLCHFVGTYCDEKIPLTGICLVKKRSFCCFQSRLSRIIHEQGRGQLGMTWGTAEAPNCEPLTIEQIQKIDFGKINLSELYGEVLGKININKQTTVPVSHEKIDSKIKEKSMKA